MDSLGDRMKQYEDAWRVTLPRRVPVIIRVDGRAFHTLTRDCARPFDGALMAAMDAVALALCEEVQGAQLAFVQSDEVSVLVHGYRTIQTEPWFDGGLQKMASVSASVATAAFNGHPVPTGLATFDSRVFLVPEDEVCNYFLWRQRDAERNSLQMVAHCHYSPVELHGKDRSELQEMVFQRGVNWNDFPARKKRGRCALRRTFERGGVARAEWYIDSEVPVFSQDRDYVERHVRIHREEPACPVP